METKLYGFFIFLMSLHYIFRITKNTNRIDTSLTETHYCNSKLSIFQKRTTVQVSYFERSMRLLWKLCMENFYTAILSFFFQSDPVKKNYWHF